MLCIAFLQRFAENLQIKKAKNETAHVQYLKDQRKNWKGSLFAFLEVARTLQTAVLLREAFLRMRIPSLIKTCYSCCCVAILQGVGRSFYGGGRFNAIGGPHTGKGHGPLAPRLLLVQCSRISGEVLGVI